MWRICYAKSSVYVTLFLCTFQEKDPALAEKIEEFIARLKTLKEVEEEFTLVSLADSKLQKILFNWQKMKHYYLSWG